MDSGILKQLLTEYDSKRMHAITSLENRKQHLRESSKEYVALEKDMQATSLESIRSMLSASENEKEQKLQVLQKKTDDRKRIYGV